MQKLVETKNFRYSSRVLRTALVTLLVGLLLPVASFALSHDHPIDRFEQQIKSFETRDKKEAPKPGGTVFVGSSTFVHWRNLETDLKDFDPINRGFGGSTIPEVNHYIDRIVINYKPAQVVFYAGTNDLAEGHSAQRVCDDFLAFAAKVHKALPKTQIYFVSMSVAPVRLNLKPSYDEGNELVFNQIEKTPYLHYIDVIPAMRTKDGKLRDDYFLPDKLHMTSVGYEKWTPIIRSALIKGGAVVKVSKDTKLGKDSKLETTTTKGSLDAKAGGDLKADTVKGANDPKAVKDAKEIAPKAEVAPRPAEVGKGGAPVDTKVVKESKADKNAAVVKDPKPSK